MKINKIKLILKLKELLSDQQKLEPNYKFNFYTTDKYTFQD